MKRKLRHGLIGLFSSFQLNMAVLKAKLSQKKVLVFQLHASNQLSHIESVLAELSREPYASKIECFILVSPNEISAMKISTNSLVDKRNIFSYHATTFLCFWNLVVAIDQRMRFPILNFCKGFTVCMFHGQPTKGNVYSGFNFRNIMGLFFYGPMMRDHYLDARKQHAAWPTIRTWDIGQPKSDDLIRNMHREPASSKMELGLDPMLKTILYAPSFESCASLALWGEEVIGILIQTGCNIIIKPHPSFFRVLDSSDDYFKGVPCADEWKPRAEHFSKSRNVLFPITKQIDSNLALAAADVLLTDHSGIAFDAILLDKPVAYIDCPDFFSKYLPMKFGVNGDKIKNDVSCNAGRMAGVVASSTKELEVALNECLEQPERRSKERRELRDILLFNQGSATDRFAKTINELLGGTIDR